MEFTIIWFLKYQSKIKLLGCEIDYFFSSIFKGTIKKSIIETLGKEFAILLDRLIGLSFKDELLEKVKNPLIFE